MSIFEQMYMKDMQQMVPKAQEEDSRMAQAAGASEQTMIDTTQEAAQAQAKAEA